MSIFNIFKKKKEVKEPMKERDIRPQLLEGIEITRTAKEYTDIREQVKMYRTCPNCGESGIDTENIRSSETGKVIKIGIECFDCGTKWNRQVVKGEEIQ